MASLLSSDSKKDNRSSREYEVKYHDFGGGGRRETKESKESDRFTSHVKEIKELTSQMTSAARFLGAEMASLHETVCNETDACKAYIMENDRIPQALHQKLQNRTSDLKCEVRVLESHLEQLKKLLVLKQTHNNGINELDELALCRENDINQSKTEQLSFEDLKGKLETALEEKDKLPEERKEWMKKEKRLKQDSAFVENTNGNSSDALKQLEVEKKELEDENIILKQQLNNFKDKLHKCGIEGHDAVSLTYAKDETGDKGAVCMGSDDSLELVSLRKERKLLLNTVLRLQNQRNVTLGSKTNDLCRQDAAVQCKINVLGQMENHGVSLSGELETKRLTEMQAEIDELEEENKSLDEENSTLTEEKRSLEDSVNKLKSQITDTLDSSLDELDHFHQVVEELQQRLQLAEAKNKTLRESIVEVAENNSNRLTSVLDEIERKHSLEDAFDYLAYEVEKLSEVNNLAIENACEPLVPWDALETINQSSLLGEIKACKELIDSQRDQIRQLQLDKRDVEDKYINLKREILVLRSKRREERLAGQPQSAAGTENMKPARKDSHERCEFLKQEILRLTTRRTELEGLILTLKSDNTTLEEEKVCLLDSLYHQLERNELLEVQIDNLKTIIMGYNGSREFVQSTTNQPFQAKQESRTMNGDRETDENQNELMESALDVDVSQDAVKVDVKSLELKGESVKGNSVEELKTSTALLKEQLHCLESRLLETVTEKESLQRELNKSSESQEELRSLVAQLKAECAVLKSQLEKNKEFSGTLQECLREAHEEKEELMESLDDITEEKTALENKVELTENQLNQLNEKYQLLKDELESAHVNGVGNSTDLVYTKLLELYKFLFGVVRSSDDQTTETLPKEELQTDLLSVSEKISEEAVQLSKELKRVKSEKENLKARLDASQTEKLALQKLVKELDEKRKQVKSFVIKLTEEKEFMSEHMDEIKQQKNNLADALENVYQNKENMQCQLEDALHKQQQYRECFDEASAEMQSLKNSLYRLAEERDAVKQVLLEVKKELITQQETGTMLNDKENGAENDADHESFLEICNTMDDEESEPVNRLQIENTKLRETLEKLQNALQKGIREGICKASEMDGFHDYESDEDDIEASTASTFESAPLLQTNIAVSQNYSSENGSHKQILLENTANDDHSEVLHSRYKELCQQNETLSDNLKRSAEEVEQFRSWFDSISVEKDNLEKEQERMATENEELLKDLERTRLEEEKLRLRVEELLKQREQKQGEGEGKSSGDLQASLEATVEENNELQKELQKRDDVCKEMKESLQLANMRNRSLESEANESWEKATALEKSLRSFKERNETLNKRIPELQKENDRQSLAMEKLTKDYSSVQQLCEKLEIENKKLEKVSVECEEQKNKIAKLLRNNELLEKQHEQKSEEIKELKQTLKGIVKDKEDLELIVREMESREQSVQGDHSQLEEEVLKTRQDLQNTATELSSLKSQLKSVQDNLDVTEEDLEILEEERDDLKDKIERITKENQLLIQQIDQKSQESANLLDSIEKLTREKDSLERELKRVLQDVSNQWTDLQTFLGETLSKITCVQHGGDIQEEASDVYQHVRASVEALVSERALLKSSLAEQQEKLQNAELESNDLREKLQGLKEDLVKAEITSRQVREDNRQLLLERTELTIQLQEALGEKQQTKEESTRRARDDVRLSREISDVRSLIEKLSLQKEKLGAALANKENQIATVTATAHEKAKRLEEKEKEAAGLSHSKKEVITELQESKKSCQELNAQLKSEKVKVDNLKQDLLKAKKQFGCDQDEKSDLKACVTRLDKEKTTLKESLENAECKCLNLEKQLHDLEQENVDIRRQSAELDTQLKAQRQFLTTEQQVSKENKEKWKKTLDEKDGQLEMITRNMKELKTTLSNSQDTVDELKRKNNELQSQYNQAEKSRKEVIEEKNNLKKRLDNETGAKRENDARTKDLEKEHNKFKEEIKDLKRCIASIDKEKESLKRNMKVMEDEKTTTKQRVVQLDAEKKSAENELKMAKSEVRTIREELEIKTANLLQTEKELNNLNDFIRERKQKFLHLEEENEKLKKAAAATECKLRQAETRAGKTKEQNEKLKEKLDAIEKEMTALNSALDTARNDSKVLLLDLKTDRERIEKELKEMKVEFDTLMNKLEKTRMELVQEKEQRKDAVKEKRRVKDEYEVLKKSVNALKEKEDKSSNERHELDITLQKAREQAKCLQEEVDRIYDESIKSKNSSQRFIEELRDECNTLKQKLENLSKEKCETQREKDKRRRVEDELEKLKEEYTASKASSRKVTENLEAECSELKDKLEKSSKEGYELKKKLEQTCYERNVAKEELLKLNSPGQDTEDAKKLLSSENDKMETLIQSTEALNTESENTTYIDEKMALDDEVRKEREISCGLRAQLEELNDEKDELEEIIEEFRNKTKRLQEEMDALIVENDILEDKLDENSKFFKQQIGALNDEKEELTKQLEIVTKDKTSLCEEIRAKEVDYGDVLDQGKKLEDTLEKSKREINLLSCELDTATARRKTLEEELKKNKDVLKEMENKVGELTARSQDIICELAERKNENSTLRLAVEEITLAKEESEMKSGTADKYQQDKLAQLQIELDEKNTQVASLLEQINEQKRMREEEEKHFSEREANLAAAREEFFKTSKERWEEEERMESIRRANNRLQEALDIAKNETNQLRKQLQEVTGGTSLQPKSVQDTQTGYNRKKTSNAGQQEEIVEKVLITSSKVPELSHVPPTVELNQSEEVKSKHSPLDNAKKEIALLESHVQELRRELRTTRDQVFDLQQELSDASRTFKHQELLHQQERKRFHANIEKMEKECNKLRREHSSLIAMEKDKSLCSTIEDLKGSLRKAESAMLDAITLTVESLSRAKNQMSKDQGEPEADGAGKSSRRSKSFTETSTKGQEYVSKQLDDVSRERERLEKELKRAEGTKLLLKQILSETLIELERFKRLVEFGHQQGKEQESDVSTQEPGKTTREVETQSILAAGDFGEMVPPKKRLEELRSNNRGLAGSLEEERANGEVNLVDYLRVKNKLQAEKNALQQCLAESQRKSDSLQALVDSLRPKLELALEEKIATDKEIAEVRGELIKLRNLSYDEREEKNALKRENEELKRALPERNESNSSAVKQKEKLNALEKEKSGLLKENEELKSCLSHMKSKLETGAKSSKKEHSVAKSVELENARFQVKELSETKETLENQNRAIETELRRKKETLEDLQTKYSDLKNRYIANDEKWKSAVKQCTAIESELRLKSENHDILKEEHSDLQNKFRTLEDKWKSVDEERMKLVEDAHSFKVKLEKKNNDLLSKLEAKEHEVISLEAKIEGLGSLQKNLDNDVRSLEKEKDDVLSQLHSLRSAKERVEARNKELKIQIEELLLAKSDQGELDEKIKNLFSENDKLDALNKNLEMTLHRLKMEVDRETKDKAILLQEKEEMSSRLGQLEKEKQEETYLKDQLALQLEEKDREMKIKTQVLSSRLDGILKETENLKNSSGKMEQMGIEFSRLEDENIHLIEMVERLREENSSLIKETDLLRRACQQLRARKYVQEEKPVENVQNSEVGCEPDFIKETFHWPLGHQFQPIRNTVTKGDINEYPVIAAKVVQRNTPRPAEIARDIKLSKALVAPFTALSGEETEGQVHLDTERKWSHSTPPMKQRQWTSITEPEIKPHGSSAGVYKRPSPISSDTESSRSSDADHSVCSKNFYCSPILSLVDMCPLHRNPSIERTPNQCPICKKDRRRTGTVPKQFLTLEKYV